MTVQTPSACHFPFLASCSLNDFFFKKNSLGIARPIRRRRRLPTEAQHKGVYSSNLVFSWQTRPNARLGGGWEHRRKGYAKVESSIVLPRIIRTPSGTPISSHIGAVCSCAWPFFSLSLSALARRSSLGPSIFFFFFPGAESTGVARTREEHGNKKKTPFFLCPALFLFFAHTARMCRKKWRRQQRPSPRRFAPRPFGRHKCNRQHDAKQSRPRTRGGHRGCRRKMATSPCAQMPRTEARYRCDRSDRSTIGRSR